AMRELLEGHALRLAFERGDIEWEGGVVAAHHKLASIEQQMAAGRHLDPEKWRHYDWAFHAALIAACGSTVLLETHAAIRDKYLRYQMIAAIYRGRAASEEHLALRDAARGRALHHLDRCAGARPARSARHPPPSQESHRMTAVPARPLSLGVLGAANI